MSLFDDETTATRVAHEPVEIEVVRRCHFKAKLCGLCDKPKSNKIHRKKNREEGLEFCPFKRHNGCAHCGKPKNDPDHLGAPESYNAFDTNGAFVFDGIKARWRKALVPALAASGLSKDLHTITVEAEVSFGDATKRDQGNHRVIIEKALGDVLVEEGYLPDDSWDHYEFGGLARREEQGVNRIRLMLFPATVAVTAL